MTYQPLYQSNIARSGSFLLRMMLSTNPEVHCASEPFLELYRDLRNTAVSKHGGEAAKRVVPPNSPMQDYYFLPERIEALDCVQNFSLDTPYPQMDREEFLQRVRDRIALDSEDLVPHVDKMYGTTFRELFDTGRAMIAEGRNVASRRWVGSGDSWAIEFFGPLAAAYPNAKFIVIFRDPRAIISSNLGEAAKNPEWVAEPLSYLRNWRKLYAFTLHFANDPRFRDRLFVLRHEDLIAEPEALAHKLCNFLDVPFHSDMIDTEKYFNHATGEIWNGNSSFEVRTSGFSTHRANRWRDKLPAPVRKLIEHTCGAEMRSLGFETEVDPTRFPDAEVVEYLEKNQSAYASWRTSLGDVQTDLGFEFARLAFLHSKSKQLDPLLIRRNFLFNDVYDLLTADKAPKLLSY